MFYTKKILKTIIDNSRHIRFNSNNSSLYIYGDKASKHFAVLTPYIDFELQIQNKNVLIENIKSRHLKIDIDHLEERWQFFKNVDDQKKILEMTRSEIHGLISNLIKENNEKNNDDIEKLKLHNKLVKDDLKNMKEFYNQINESVHLQILHLPNILHEKTPRDKEIILHKHLEKPSKSTKSHMDIAIDKNLIQYTMPYSCYLKSEAALFEMSLINYLRSFLLDLNYIQFSSPDFARSIIVEGCGKNFEDKNVVFTLEEPHDKLNELSRLHLTGGGSLEAFMGYFTKHFIQPNQFPLNYFATGRKYQPFNHKLPNNLFNLTQESVLNLFISYLDNEEQILEKIKNEIISFYDSLGYHYKVVLTPAKDLHYSECFKLSVQMFSNYLQDYVEIGNLSLYDTYLSKRLLFTTSVNRERIFPKILAGNVLNVHKFLGCALENNEVTSTSLMSQTLEKYMFM